jgi:signal transduction histidine kinase
VVGHSFGLRANAEDEPDELDTIENVVDKLTNALTQVRAEQAAHDAELGRRRREYGELVSTGADDVIRQLEEVRLPLHILLENHFGELNENQEEMLGAARNAAERADRALLQLREIADFDLGKVPLRQDVVRLSDVMASLLPALRIEAEAREIRVDLDVAPALPAIHGDRGRLQEALVTILQNCLRRTPSGKALLLSAERDGASIRVVISGARGDLALNEWALPIRILRAHRGTFEVADDTITIRLPLQPLG